MIKLIGKDKNFVAYFDCQIQQYTVYYKGNVLVSNKFRYCEIEPYLN